MASIVTLLSFALAASAQSSVATTARVATTAAVVPTRATITAAPSSAAAAAASTPRPLTEYTYAYDAVPYQVNPFRYLRGPQSGFNQCNSTTEGVSSECQTAIVNSLSDFCLWGAPETTPNGTIGDVEAAVVAYCTGSGHGARIMPAGTITGAQFMRTSKYIQVVGTLNQTGINLISTDTGGELDPHGADLLGNPLGGLVYSNNLVANGTSYQQAISWNNFIGSGVFCFKLCLDTSFPNYCQNIYDLIGCHYNAPADYVENVFQSCDGDLQDPAGTYTVSGVAYTWSQPRSIPATSTLPWQPRVPASSNCVAYQSTDLYPIASLGYQRAAAVAAAGTTAGALTPATAAATSRRSSTTGSGTSSAASPSSSAARANSAGVVGVTGTSLSLLIAGFFMAAL